MVYGSGLGRGPEEEGDLREKGWRSKNGKIFDTSVAGSEEVAELVV